MDVQKKNLSLEFGCSLVRTSEISAEVNISVQAHIREGT